MRLRHSLLAALLAAALSPNLYAQSAKASRFYEDALKRYEKRDVSGAIVQLKNALQEERGFLPALLLLGKASLEDSNPGAAEGAFLEAQRLGVNRSEVAESLALAMMAQGKHAQMLQDPNLQPAGLPPVQQAKLLLVRAAAQTDLGDSRAALQSIDQARQLNPNDAQVWLAEVPLRIRSGAQDAALAAVDRALKLAPGSAEAHYQRGTVFHSRNQLDVARQEYDEAIKLNPNHLEALVARAGIALDNRQPDKALQDIQTLRKNHPNDPRADYMQAVIAEAKGDRATSQAAMRRVAELVDQAPFEFVRFRPQMLMLGGLSHYALNEPEKAKPFLESLIKQQPRNPSAKLLAQILFNEGQVENGISALETYVRSAPQDLGALALMATGHSLQGRHGKAAQLMNQALRNYDSVELRGVLGQALMRQGKLDEAEQQLALAWKREPNRAVGGTALAMLHLRQGQPAKAVPVAKAVVALNPANASAHHLLGIAQAAAGDLKGARASYQQALKLDGKLVEAQLSLARLDAREGNVAAARKTLEGLVAADEKALDPILELAGLSRREGKLEESERWMERGVTLAGARELRPNFGLVDIRLVRNDPVKALEAAKVLYSKAPEDPVVLIALARTQLANGDTTAAKPTLVQASRRVIDSPAQMAEVASLQFQARDLPGASYSLSKLLEEDPDNVQGLVLQASIDMEQGDMKAATARASRVMALRPKEAVSHLLAAEVAIARQQPNEALAALRKAHEVQPSTATAMRIFLHLSRFDAGNAAETFADAWLRRRADDNTVRRALAEQQMARERWPTARAGFEELLRRNPRDAQALNNLALILVKQGEASKALSYSERALKETPANPLVIDTHAWVLHLNGQNDRALGLLRDARLRAPDNAEIRYHLAAVLAKMGRNAEARSELRAALQAPAGLESVKDAQRLLETLK